MQGLEQLLVVASRQPNVPKLLHVCPIFVIFADPKKRGVMDLGLT